MVVMYLLLSLVHNQGTDFTPTRRPSGRRFCVRPAWAHSCGLKSRRKLITANEVKRNCMRVTECGEEAWIEAASRWTRIGYKALPSRASGHETAKLS